MGAQVVRRNFRQYDKDDGLSGVFAPGYNPWISATGSTGLTANRAYFARVRPSRPMTIVAIKFSVIVAATGNDACDVGIYDAAGNKIVTAGATTGKLNAASNSIQSVTIASTTLQANTTYYAAFSQGTIVTAVANVAMTNPGGGANSPFGDFVGTAIGTRMTGIVATSHPLPAGPVTLTSSGVVPVLFLSEV